MNYQVRCVVCGWPKPSMAPCAKCEVSVLIERLRERDQEIAGLRASLRAAITSPSTAAPGKETKTP